VPSIAFEKELLMILLACSRVMKEAEVPMPWFLSISALSLRGFAIYTGTRSFGRAGRVLTKDDLLLPPILIDSESKTQGFMELATAVKPAFDHFWREFNYQRSLNYDDSGAWRAH
jgi:hypothetical protein